MKRFRKDVQAAFTLIELLVVVTIIALLAGILMPALSNAREQAKSVQCLSNMRNIGTSLHIYQSGNRSLFPTAYTYINGATSGGGYIHWTASLDIDEYKADPTAGKYPKHDRRYVCPSHMSGGWAPSNFTLDRIPDPPAGQAPQSAHLDDRQSPRLSYVANEAIMPRKKFDRAYDIANPPGTGNLRLVSADEIEAPSNTILIGEFSDSSNCIYGDSVGGGAAYKSHRPTNGVKVAGGGVFDGEGYVPGTEVFKLTADEAHAAIDAVLLDKSAAKTNHHISYINPNAHKTGSNYVFADGHAAKFTLEETLDPSNYMWGRRVYSSVDRPEIKDNP